jgi:hypothetical protein
MPIETIAQESFGAGEVDITLSSRVSLPTYSRSAKTLENVVILPQGPVEKRRGLEFISDLTGVSVDAYSLAKFSFNVSEEYLLAFYPLGIKIWRNKVLKATVTTPYTASDVNDLRTVQSGDTLIIVHPSYAPRQLVRNASDTDWSLSVVTFLNVTYNRFNQVSLCTPSATTGAITLTLDKAPGWRAGHAQNGKVKINTGIAEITSFPQAATGGTALTSAGTASNAFDNNAGTVTSAGTNGWIGYTFTGSTTVRIVGIKSNATQTSAVIFETDSGPSFSTAVSRGTTTVDLVAGTTVWIDVTSPSDATNFRVRVTDGSTLTIQDAYFATGLVATATVTTTLASTTQSNNWSEWGWSPARGYPRTATFYQNRLIFGGTRDAPATIFGSKTGDFFNFDNSATTADFGFAFTLNTDQVHTIRDLKSKRFLNIFTSDGELEMSGTDASGLTPTSVRVSPQSTFGISDISVVEADNQLHYITRNYKELRSYIYSVSTDGYISDNKTLLAPHLFIDTKEPWSMAYLRSYRNTQSNLIFVTREDGNMAVLTTQYIDGQQNVLAWSRWSTDNGIFRDVQVASITDINGKIKDALFVVVKRTINGVDKVTLEMLTEDDVWLDCHHVGSDVTAKTTWSGLTILANEDVKVVADGFPDDTYTVNGSGQITINNAANEIVAGLEYIMTVTPQPLRVVRQGAPVRGKMMRKVRTIVDVIDSLSLSIDGKPVPFRNLGSSLLDDPLDTFTGTKERRISGIGKDISISLTSSEPLPCTIAGITTEVKITR